MEFSGIDLTFVPGLSTENQGMPDVMRGEETQILGALAMTGRDGLYLYLCPVRTHSAARRSTAAGSCRSGRS